LATDPPLKDLLHRPGLSRLDRLLICLASDGASPKTVKSLKAVAKGGGLSAAAKWNISDILSNSNGLAVRTPSGWETTALGQDHLSARGLGAQATPASSAATLLRQHLSSIANPLVAAFVEEGVKCLEDKLLRAAVVLSWVGAVSILQNHVLSSQLGPFNSEAKRRDARWKDAKTVDDLSRMKESDFLDILESVSVIGKNVKLELAKCLQLRNGAGHPNSLVIGENAVAAHIETLVLNVYSKFPA